MTVESHTVLTEGKSEVYKHHKGNDNRRKSHLTEGKSEEKSLRTPNCEVNTLYTMVVCSASARVSMHFDPLFAAPHKGQDTYGPTWMRGKWF